MSLFRRKVKDNTVTQSHTSDSIDVLDHSLKQKYQDLDEKLEKVYSKHV